YINGPQELGFIKIGNSYPFIVNPTNVNNVTLAHGINSSGEVVGSYTDAAGTHGFVYLTQLGVFAPFYDPGFPTVILNGINEMVFPEISTSPWWLKTCLAPRASWRIRQPLARHPMDIRFCSPTPLAWRST